MASYNRIIKASPPFVRKAYYSLVPFRKRYGKTFNETLDLISMASSWDEERKRTYQLEQLKGLVTHCQRNVPYYRELFRKLGFDPQDLKGFEDYAQLPFLTKSVIRENYEDFASSDFNGRKYVMSTSGSTGNKLTLFCDDHVFKKEAAFVLDSYRSHGATLYDKWSVWLRRFVPEKGGKLYYYDHELRRLYLSAYHINENTIDFYIGKINEHRYHTLVGYPSSVYILSQVARKKGLALKHIKAIHTTSEMMLDKWQEEIHAHFGIMPVSHYGQIEKAVFFSQDPKTLYYRENPLYGYTEYFANDSGTYDVVGTGFLNRVMPLLRYRTEDQVDLAWKENSPFPVITKIHGRSSDILISSDGSRLPGVNFYSWVDKSVPGVGMFQIRQRNREEVDFTFVRSPLYEDGTVQKIESGLRERLGDLRFTIREADEIARDERSGKIRCIINEIRD